MPDRTTSQMPSHRFLLAIFAGSLLTGTIGQVLAAEAGETANRPNILFIMADDHTTQAIGAYGSHLAGLNPTPTIDALAKNGIRFDRVYCNNSICTPSRASIISGQYPQTHGVLDLNGNIPPSRQHLPREMKKAGYHSYLAEVGISKPDNILKL